MTRGNLVSVIVIIAIFFTLGAACGYFFANSAHKNSVMMAAREGQDDSFEAGWQAAQKTIDDAGVLIATQSVHSLDGEILNVGSDYFVVQTPFQPRNPLAERAPDKRTVLLSADTQFIKRTLLPLQVYVNLQRDYTEELTARRERAAQGEDTGSTPQPPSRFVEQKITRQDLQEGDSVLVTVSQDLDITYLKEFSAESVIITTN